MSFRVIQSFAAAAVMALASSSFAVVPWATPSGSNSQISYSGGQSDNGLFGEPTVNGSQFLFFPSNFKASSANGVAAQTTDRLQFKLTAKPGQTFTQIVIKELGDFSINGTGNVNAFGTLYVTKLTNPGFGTVVTDPETASYYSASIPTTPSNVTGVKNGTWNTNFVANLPAGTTEVMIVLNNVLSATSGANSTSFIEKKVVGPEVMIDVVLPEPASIGMILVGGAGMLLRRKRPA